jgi:hypothetical protein
VIADAHNDLLLELVLRCGEPNPFAARWLPKLRAGGVHLQVCRHGVRAIRSPARVRAAAGAYRPNRWGSQTRAEGEPAGQVRTCKWSATATFRCPCIR